MNSSSSLGINLLRRTLCSGLAAAIGFFGFGFIAYANDLQPIVEIEEKVYDYVSANNGAGPMWCSGSTSLARVGNRLFASGLETVADAKPLNNCRWMLFTRGADGWTRVRVDEEGRTREPSPLAVFHDGRLFLSANPTLGTAPQPNGGPARPDVFQFDSANPSAEPKSLTPKWRGEPQFTEHSYRTFVADGAAGELLLFQNIGYTHAEWAFLDRSGEWSSQGRLNWPLDVKHSPEHPQPIRVCYPNVALRDRAVHFIGVSDVQEPNLAWRKFKRELTGREWDYDFRRLFYAWTPDITKEPFRDWVEIASCDQNGGHAAPGDLWLAPNGDAHLVWSERALDERLREKFFPDAKQKETLNYGVIRAGKLIRKVVITETSETAPGLLGSQGRFQITPDHRLFVIHLVSGIEKDGRRVFENRVMEIGPDGKLGSPVRIPFQKPFTSYFTATVRAGSPLSWTVDMLGVRAGDSNTISYARVNLLRRP